MDADIVAVSRVGVPGDEARRGADWEIREAMQELDVELILERAKELVPKVRQRIISDNGP